MGQFIGGRSYAEKRNLPSKNNPFSLINDHILASDVFIPSITLFYLPV